jgi:hypothetical protein
MIVERFGDIDAESLVNEILWATLELPHEDISREVLKNHREGAN